MAITRVAVTAVLLVLYWSTHQAKAQVTISVDYTAPPDFPFPPGSNEYRAGSGPLTFTCRVGGAVASGVTWASTCNCLVAGSTANPIRRGAITSGDTGTHTCTVSGESSESVTVNIVGAGIHIFRGRSSTSTGIGDFSLPNNGLVVTLGNPDNGFRFRIFCRSDSMMENVGDFIGLDGGPVSTGGPFLVQQVIAGEISLENPGSDPVLGTTQQGVYTCRIPDAAGMTREINVGVYTSSFNDQPTITNPLVFTPGSSSSNLTCTSTTSIATTVTFTRSNSDGTTTTVGPLRDGGSMGGTYELTQTVTDRGASTFDNVLTINQPLADIMGSSFSCSVTNSIGTSTASDTLEIMDDPTVSIVTSTDPVGSGVAGEDYSITCTVVGADTLGATFSILWLRPGGDVLAMATESSLTHTFTPLGQSDEGIYTCMATVSSILLSDDLTPSEMLTVTVTIPPVSVVTSTNPVGAVVAGEDYSITCTVVGADTLGATFNIMWLRPGGDVLAMATSTESSLTHTFNSVGESDEGMYTCEATVSSTLLSDDITPSGMQSVTVTRPSLTPMISADPESTVFGGSLTLTCSVTHNLGGTTTYGWILPDGGPFTGSSIVSNQLTLSSAGTYTCEATITGSPYLTSALVTAGSTRDVSIPIPEPTVGVSRSGGVVIYAGSVLTLTCRVTLVSIQPSSDVTVMVTWFGAGGNVLRENSFVTINPTQQESSTQYISTVEFNTLRTGNAGTYTCQGTVSHTSPFITDAKRNGTVAVSPITVPTLMLSVDSNATRLPNVDPFNTFVLTCTATAPVGVVQQKSFTWRRTSGSSGSCSSLTEVSNTPITQIMSSNLEQPVSTSVLTVTESNAAIWRYCCQAILTDLGVSGTPNNVLSIEVVGPASPEAPMNLMIMSSFSDRVTIQWTVPVIAYTPETYVVMFGLSMSSLNMMSPMVQSGDDFETTNQVLSVEVTGLTDTTTYHYRVVATNGQGSTSSGLQSFMTTILRPGPPLNFMSTMLGTTTLSFSWNPPEPREGLAAISDYIVRCEPQLAGIPTPTAVIQSASQPLTATVSGLAPGVTYSCSVAAINDRGEGERAEDTAMTQEIAPTGAPQSFNIVPGPTSRELTFSWDLPLPTERNGVITSYTISCSPDTETLPRTVPGEEGLMVGGFRPFTNYSCMIVASNSQGSGPPASVTRRTDEDVPEGPPLSPSVAVTSDPESLMFTVQPPEQGLRNGEITSYSVNCDPSDAYPSVFVVMGTLTSESGIVGGFTAAADYDCSFTAFTSVGEGPPSMQLRVTTLPGTPVITSVMNQSSSEVLVTWNITLPSTTGPGASTLYTIYVDDNEGVNTADGTTLTYVIRNLVPYQLVMVQVSASTSAGEGVRSAAKTARSSETSPGPVSNILWNPQSASSVDVSWSEPERPNGVILGYSVVLENYIGGVIGTADVDNITFAAFFNGTSIEAEVPYNVTVTARTSAGVGEPAEIVNFTVEANSPPAPIGVSVVRSNDNTQMTVSWIPSTVVQARSLIRFYRVTYSPATGGSRKKQSGTTCSLSPCDVPGNESSVMITGLNPAINYDIQVAIVNGGWQPGVSSPPMTVEPVTTVPPTTEDEAPAQSLPSIVGGVVAVVLIIAGAAIVIVILVLRHRNHPSSLSIQKHAESVKWSEVAKSGDLDIKTAECVAYSPVSHPHGTEYEIPTMPCAAYGQSQQIPRIQEEGTYEIIPGETGQPPAEMQRPPESEYETINPAGENA